MKLTLTFKAHPPSLLTSVCGILKQSIIYIVTCIGMQKNLCQVQKSTVKYRFSFQTSDQNVKIGCHAIFFCRDSTSFLRVIYITLDKTHSFLIFLAIHLKICGNSQFANNFITQEIRRKKRRFTL